MERYVPKSASGRQVRYLAIAAHKDDVEMMAVEGIMASRIGMFGRGGCENTNSSVQGVIKDVEASNGSTGTIAGETAITNGGAGFAAVVLTDGGACPRSALYEYVSDEDMALIRTAEQKRAAEIGGYEALYLFEMSSQEVKSRSAELIGGLVAVLKENPAVEVLYLHNLFDSHATHVGAALAAIEAVKKLEKEERPKKILGCELWRGLDWLSDEDKIALNVGGSAAVAEELLSVFDSQNSVKRYDIAAEARRRANATFFASHKKDVTDEIIFAVDMTKLVETDMTAAEFVEEKIGNLKKSVLKNLG